jgi:pseudouridine kinase
MRICVIGGANVDIGARAAGLFVAGDSNPGTITVAPGGVGRNIAHNLALLGDSVRLVTVFGDDGFGRMLRESCSATGMDLSLSQTVSGARNACFVSVNGSDGELFGGVSDMAITGLMTPEWLESRLHAINDADAVVADANLPAETLSMLVGCCLPPLYIDAVSSAKGARLREALSAPRLPGAGPITVKCNRIEAEVLGTSGLSGVARLVVSLGSEGLEIIEDGETLTIPPLPAVGIVNTTGAGDALLAGIVHCGPDAPAADAANFGQKCARLALMSPNPVNERIKELV